MRSMLLNVSSSTLIFFVVIAYGWLLLLSILLLRALTNYNRLTRGISSKTLSEILKDFLDKDQIVEEEHRKVLTEIKKLRHESDNFLQKIGMVRFNPFSDTGGDQSFVISLLDNENNGIVITSLYARSGTRWYVKQIKAGKGVEYELSKEEKEAIKKAN